MAPPATFSGVAEDCSGFLLQCSLQFEMQLQRFTTDRTKITYIILLLSGRAFQWAKSIWEQGQTVTCMLDAFISHLREVFGQAENSIMISYIISYNILIYSRNPANHRCYSSLRVETLAGGSQTSVWPLPVTQYVSGHTQMCKDFPSAPSPRHHGTYLRVKFSHCPFLDRSHLSHLGAN